MKGYIYLNFAVKDRQKWDDYTKLSVPAVKAAGGTYLIAGGPVEILEGPDNQRKHVLVQFESTKAAGDFYRSAEYQAARAQREGAADISMIVLEEAVSTPAPAWSVANWIGFWSNPDPDVARGRIPKVVTPDVRAYWPFASREAVGVEEYRDRVLALLELSPDLKLELNEFAVEGNNAFVRWTGRGTGPDGRYSMTGVDRVVTRDGFVRENRIFSDCSIFKHLAERTKSA